MNQGGLPINLNLGITLVGDFILHGSSDHFQQQEGMSTEFFRLEVKSSN